ncbi:MAG: 50S ribosomal protein L25 [Pirellulaceae bacterium]
MSKNKWSVEWQWWPFSLDVTNKRHWANLGRLDLRVNDVTDVLNVIERNETGSARMRRLRSSGKVPAVLYGHGQQSMPLTLELKELEAVMRHSGHFVTLKGAANESALIKDVQFDHFEQCVLHVDLFRVDLNEKVEVSVSVVLKGTAKGQGQGGVVSAPTHEVTLNCPAFAIPDQLILKISELELGGSLRASDLELPSGAELAMDASTVLAHCELPAAQSEGDESGAGAAEPELIGKKAEADE